MSEAQGPGGGALEPHYGGGFGPPPTKDHYSTVNSNGGSNGLTELTSSSETTTHLTLLKNAPTSNSSSSPHSNTNSSGLPSFTSFGDNDGLGSRLSDAFSEIRYAELQHWDLNTYSTEGLTARLIDSRSIDSPDHTTDHYRPWEKPTPNTTHQSPTSSTSVNGATLVSTTTAENGISSTNGHGNDKSPTTLTPLTNVFPTFSETFAPNGPKLPSFQSQFNSFQEPAPLVHHIQPHNGDQNGASSLPSFHTLPANRGYVHNPTHTTIHQGHNHCQPAAMITTQAQPHQFFDERHIQIFPGQVQIGPGQLGQLIATTTAGQQTMTITTNGHHLASPHGHHHFNGNGVNGGNFGGISAPPTPSPVAPLPTSTSGGSIQLQELVPVPPMHTILHPTTILTNNNSSTKLPQQTTDGNLPGLNLNIIHHDPHHPSAHVHHPSPHLNLNMPKYLHSAGVPNNDHLHPIETHFIAVKIPGNHYEHSPHGQINPNMLHHHQQHIQPHLLHQPGGGVVHHSITKLEQQQCSPQIISTNNGTNNNGTNGTNGTPKRQVNRKRKGMDHHQQGMLGDNGITHISNHDLNDPQVSSVSSTDSDFKRPSLGNGLNGNGINGNGMNHSMDDSLDKPTKKKRKRCGECTGCQRKDNCGDCAPCRNDKSHQICKMRRCDKLTEKKARKAREREALQRRQQQEQQTKARGEEMDGRGRQGNSNSCTPASANTSVMPNYGYQGSETNSSGGSAYSPRDRFWSTPTSTTTPEPWGPGSYTPQLELTSFSNQSQTSPGNQNYIPYGGHNSQQNGGPPINNNPGDLSFSGPSPPNQLQPVSVSSSPYPPPSPRRQYTPSTTPSPHIGSHPQQQQNDPQQSPTINGNGINGNSNHSSCSASLTGSPPNNNSSRGQSSRPFQTYNLNGDQQQHQSANGSMQNGQGMSMMNKNGPSGMEGPTGLGNELPGYLSHPRQSLHNSSRYPGEIKASDGEHMMQQQQQQQHNTYQHHQYYQNYGGYHNPYYQETPGYQRPYDPYQHYGSGSSYPPPPPVGGCHSDYNTTGSTSSSTDPSKIQDLLPDSGRKIDSSPTRESLQQQNQGKPVGCSTIPHDNETFASGTENDSGGVGSGSNFEGTLTNLNTSHHPQDSSSCSSQSPSSFEINYPHSGQQRTGISGGYQQPKNLSPPLKSDDSNNNNEKMKSPSYSDLTNSSGSKYQRPGHDSFLGVGHPQSPNQIQNSNSNLSSIKQEDTKVPNKSQRKSSTSSSPHSEGGDRDPITTQTKDIKPVVPNVKESIPATPKKKRKKKTAANKNAEAITKIKESPIEMSKIKEEPKETPASEYGKLNNASNMDEDARGDGEDDDPDADTTARRDDEDKKDKKDVPMVECGCFPADEVHAEPGPFYTHLGAAHNLVELRKIVETRTGFRGNQVRLEKVIYTGKEGKTSHGCPLAKWILRRGSYEEQLLFLVKHRKGHKCSTAWIVVCCVIWEGVPPHFADNLYDTLVYKLNRFGIPTTRRSDTNEQRSCACQGVDPDTCGSAFSFGCAWSMFFNGCKYARSRNVRKFRLTEEHEESELEEKVQHLATHLGPLYERVATDSYTNQIDRENEGLECRLGYRPGRPFSGVTACLDYCSHAHKDAHNMMNGCTTTVSLTRNRTISKGDDEQYHVLPLYKLDDTDEYGSKEGQKQKVKKGQLEILKKFPCKVRIRKVPLLPSRRRAKAKSSTSSSTAAKPEPGSSGLMGPAAPGGLSTSLPSPASSSMSSLKSSTDYSNPDMPPIKREKLFDDRFSSGTTGGNSNGDPCNDVRFHQAYSGMGHRGPSSHHPFSSDSSAGVTTTSSANSSWNHFGTEAQGSGGNFSTAGGGPLGPQSIHHGSVSSHLGTPSASSLGPAPFRSYFDQPFSASGGSTGSGSTAPFSNNFSNGSSSLNSLTELTNSTSISRHGSSSNLTNLGGSGSGSSILLSSPGSSSGNPGSASSGYSSMSPILPSFRNTFMTEAESMSMISSMSSPGASQPDSSSSPRTAPHGKPNSTGARGTNALPSASIGTSGSLSMSSPAFTDPSSYSYPGQGYSSGLTSGSPAGIYHPHPHNPCLPPPPMSSSGIGGVSPFSSSSYGTPAGPAFGHPAHESHYGMNLNPLNSWNPGYSSNFASPYSGYSQPMGSMGMASSNFGHPMSQYSHYQNPIHQQQMQSSWGAAPVNPFVPPNIGLNMHHGHHPPPPPPSCFVTPPKPKVIPEVNESFSDNEDCFKDPQMGGVAIALSHGSVILQCAKHEMHATTALKSPNRMYPSRICLIFYQHKSMNNRFHGWSEWEKKIEAKKLQEVKLINQGKMEASPRKMKQLIKEGYITDNQ